MDMTGERRIPAPRSMVWHALNDPAILKTCIPGCERLEAVSEHDMEATAAMRIGPIAARFNGKVHLSDIVPASAYTISGEGQGGVAGFAKGGAKVNLADDGPGATVLTYAVQAQVGGKMAQLGARLIDSTAKSLADQFFNNFTRELTERMGPSEERVFPSAPSEAVIPVSPAAVPRAPVSMRSMIPSEPLGYPLAAWIGGALWICILFLVVGPLLW
ncbi:MAG: carbon monoxide dehydrogenase subunit G [Acetobacteraceae bacterium]|nr:carbon monoxide dehydrogenase subunit G [Acetobacteraceae bacterium]